MKKKNSVEPDDEREPEEIAAAGPKVTADTAFQRCDSYTFNGKSLYPMTPERWVAAQCCGLAYGTDEMKRGASMGEGGMFYSKLYFDTILCVYLCTVSGPDVRLAFRDPDALVEASMAWANAAKIRPGNVRGKEALAVFSSMLEDLTASEGMPIDEEKGAGKGGKLPN